MSDWFQVSALAGPVEDVHRVIPKPLLHCLGCGLWLSFWNVNFQPSLRFWALWTRFWLRISQCLVAFSFPSSLIISSVPAAEIHPHCKILPPPCFTVVMVLCRWLAVFGFPQTCIRNWGSSDQRIFFFIVWELFRCSFVNSNQGFMYLYWGEGNFANKPRLMGVSQWCLSFCKFLPSPYKIMELKQSDHQCLDHLSNQDPSLSIAQFG